MDKPKKIYYTMGEVAEIFDVNCSLIRFWEKKFDILKPHKNNKGNRLFTPEDLENLKLIYHLVKENGMTLAGAEKRLKDNREGTERNIEIVEKLQRMRAMLMEVKQELKIEDGATQYISSGPLDMMSTGVRDVVEESFVDSNLSLVGVAVESPEYTAVGSIITDAEASLSQETPEMIKATPPPRVIEQTLF